MPFTKSPLSLPSSRRPTSCRSTKSCFQILIKFKTSIPSSPSWTTPTKPTSSSPPRSSRLCSVRFLYLSAERATVLVEVPHNFEFLKGLLLTLAINRIENYPLYHKILQVVLSNLTALPHDHLITITETIYYNQLHLKYKLDEY